MVRYLRVGILPEGAPGRIKVSMVEDPGEAGLPAPKDGELERTRRLIEEARAGRREAYEELFRIYSEELGARVQRLALPRGPRVAASDVIQETLVDAVRGFEAFEPRGPGSFRGWLGRILDNRVRMLANTLHAQKRDARREVNLRTGELSSSDAHDPTPSLAGSGTSPSGAAAIGERGEALERALAKLSRDHQEVLRLIKLHEHSIAETARTMGRSENAVKKLLARALLELRTALGDHVVIDP